MDNSGQVDASGEAQNSTPVSPAQPTAPAQPVSAAPGQSPMQEDMAKKRVKTGGKIVVYIVAAIALVALGMLLQKNALQKTTAAKAPIEIAGLENCGMSESLLTKKSESPFLINPKTTGYLEGTVASLTEDTLTLKQKDGMATLEIPLVNPAGSKLNASDRIVYTSPVSKNPTPKALSTVKVNDFVTVGFQCNVMGDNARFEFHTIVVKP